jgi:hypothetical protein
MQKESVQVLLANTALTPVDEIERQLEQTIGLDCHLSQCGNLDACLHHLHNQKTPIDIILLDLALVSRNDSQTLFLKIQEAAPNLPLIVFTREENRELSLFMVGEGASIISNLENFKLEPNRLRDVIEYSWIRHKTSQGQAERNATALREEKTQSAKDIREEKTKGAERLKEKDQVISWMRGDYSVEPSSKEKKT